LMIQQLYTICHISEKTTPQQYDFLCVSTKRVILKSIGYRCLNRKECVRGGWGLPFEQHFLVRTLLSNCLCPLSFWAFEVHWLLVKWGGIALREILKLFNTRSFLTCSKVTHSKHSWEAECRALLWRCRSWVYMWDLPNAFCLHPMTQFLFWK
jgi:hypothetical protein